MAGIGVCISGGGAKIGFAVGVLQVMEERGIKIDLAYGISSGAMCTAGLCYGSVQFIADTFLAIRKTSEVLKRQLLKVIWTHFTKLGKADGLYEMDTMRRKLDTLPLDKPRMKGVVGYVNLQSGNMVYTDSNSVTKKDFLDAVQASCSIPMVLQSQRVGKKNNVDGGVRDVLPLKGMIEDPMDVDEIHIISLSPLTLAPTNQIYKTILQVGDRFSDLFVNDILQHDLEYADRINKLVAHKDSLSSHSPILRDWLKDKRHVKLFKYVPSAVICGTTDFSTKFIQDGIDEGRKIALQVLAGYPSVSPISQLGYLGPKAHAT